jgi:hypothetical protein
MTVLAGYNKQGKAQKSADIIAVTSLIPSERISFLMNGNPNDPYYQPLLFAALVSLENEWRRQKGPQPEREKHPLVKRCIQRVVRSFGRLLIRAGRKLALVGMSEMV